MAMMPKRVKYRKSQKGRVRGNATRGNYVAFGDFGLQSLEPGRISAQTIEAGRIVASQSVKGGGELHLRDTQQNLFRLRLQSETERLEAPSEIIKAKREIARIKTILRLRELEALPGAAGAASPPEGRTR